MSYLLQGLSAFMAGLGTSLSPCVYPMIPITVGYLGSSSIDPQSRRKKVLGFFLGQVLAFTLLGVAAVLLGEILGFSSQIPWVQVATGCMLLLFACFSFFDRLPKFLHRMSSLSGKGNPETLLGAVLVGASSAAVASPCTSPVVGGVLAALSQVNERLWGITLMFIFATGLSFLFLLLGLGLAKASAFPRAGNWMRWVHKGSSALLAMGGIYFMFRGAGLM